MAFETLHPSGWFTYRGCQRKDATGTMLYFACVLQKDIYFDENNKKDMPVTFHVDESCERDAFFPYIIENPDHSLVGWDSAGDNDGPVMDLYWST